MTSVSMPNARTIVLVGSDLSTGGGVNRVICDLAGIFSRQLALNVIVVSARSQNPSSYPIPENVQVQYHPRGTIVDLLKVLFAVRWSSPDFVVGFWTQENILLSIVFAGSRSKLILSEHTSWNFHGAFIRLLRRVTYPLAWRLLVLNERELAHYEPVFDFVRLLPNPVKLVGAVSSAAREKLILAVGHMESRKNFQDAIEAMAASRLEEDGWSLTLIGSGPDELELRQLIRQRRLTKTRIEQPTSGLADWYSRASFILVTSRLEVFSLVLAEAMSAGVIPLAYDADGPSFILRDFPEHLLPLGDVAALGDKLRELAKLRDLELLRLSLTKNVVERFSPVAAAENWSALLNEAVENIGMDTVGLGLRR